MGDGDAFQQNEKRQESTTVSTDQPVLRPRRHRLHCGWDQECKRWKDWAGGSEHLIQGEAAFASKRG